MKATTKKMMVPVGDVFPNPDQPRRYFDAVELKRLAVSLKRRQQLPVAVRPHPTLEGMWQIVDGERRWRAAQMMQLPLWVVVDEEVSCEVDLHTASFSANFCRSGHTHAETAAAIDRELRAGRSYAEIGELVGKSEDWAKLEHGFLKLDPKVLALLDPPTPKENKIPHRVAVLLTNFPPQNQMKLWNQYKAKGAAAAFHHIRVSKEAVKSRRAVDDVRYVVSGVNQACGAIRRIADMPGEMIGRLAADQRAKVAGRLRELSLQARQTADLLEATADAGGDDE
jgi:ParB/RepB/Spo0J family partition protein